jgi:PHP family Zn ribbon phosphoesterase
MTSYAIDLHNHMPMPGGDYKGSSDTTGDDVVRAALAAGLDVLGVSDHFALGFFHRVHEAAAGTGLLVLPGAELRLSWGGEEAHLIATFEPTRANEHFTALLDALGFCDAHRAVRPQHVVIEHDPVAVARLVDEMGGMTHVAHVDRCFGPYRLLGGDLLRRLVEDSPVTALEFLDLDSAAELGDLSARVARIRCSDSHHVDEIGRRRTIVEADELSFEGVRDALRRMGRESA